MSQDAGAADTGAAYVFAYENGSWGQQAKLTADTGASGDQFGFFVGLSGNQAVVGAPQDDDAGSNAGSAYTFVAAGGRDRNSKRAAANRQNRQSSVTRTINAGAAAKPVPPDNPASWPHPLQNE
ncbi:MAG: hypothetical protein HF973_08925 [Chloroflexi bacterium]|nr:hypothetical protein [Chloroflexota bacterium]